MRHFSAPGRLVQYVVCCGTLVILGACASAGLGAKYDSYGCIVESELATQLRSTVPCCSSFSEMRFVEPENGARGIEILAGSPVFEFVGGRSRFAAFKLPSEPQAGVTLFPVISGDTSAGTDEICEPGKGRIRRMVPPAITWLDEAKRLIRTDATPTLEPSGFKFSRPANARFIVLHVGSAALGERFVHDVPRTTDVSFMAVRGAVLPIPQSYGGKVLFKATGTGRLWLTFN